MRISISDQRYAGPAGPAYDVTVGPVATDATVAELLELVARQEPAGLAGPVSAELLAAGAVVLDLDGMPVPGDARIVDLPAWAGSVLTLRNPRPAGGGPVGQTYPEPMPPTRSDPASLRRSPPPWLVEIVRVAGPDSGLRVGLGTGAFAIGRGRSAGLRPGRVDRPVVRIDVRAGDRPLVRAVDGTDPVRVDGSELDDGESRHGSFVAVGDAAFRLVPAKSAEVAEPDGGADPTGRAPLIRTPRVAVPAPPADVPVPAPPAPSPVPAPLSWLLLLAPLPIGVVMALVFSPFFLLMTAMTPLMGLARWVEAKYRARKDKVRLAVETAAAAERFARDLDQTRAELSAAARAGYADLADLCRRAGSGRGLWEVRPGDADELRVGLGIGTVPWSPDFGRRGDALSAMPELAQALTDRARLVDVPVYLDLRERSGFGAVPTEGRRVVAAAVLDLATRHGPADLSLALLVEPGRLPAWDWAKWLPHLAGDDGAPQVATEPAAAADLLSRLAADAAPAGRGFLAAGSGGNAGPESTGHTVVVVDGEDLLTGRVASLLGRLARGRGRVLVVASRADRLPSVCRTFLEIGEGGMAELTDAVTGTRTAGLLAVQAAPVICARTARALARWTDPEQAAAAAVLPDRARLVDLLLGAAAGPDALGRLVEHLDRDAVGAWWRRGAAGLRAVIGVTERGPLTVDLLADGPHGLVVGTTGAGKSELLRTVVASLACAYSPDALTFMLVDFKGGGAFDACAGLPHTVGLVTDLDEHLAARALRCLRAELRHRERRLREAGVSDLRDYLAPDPPLPRLLIVIDEFATLAVELPGFLSALIDVAQRGRSLGIHLLLATQRPQGVVDGKIRANTNLRVALRVQDDVDSRDVLGTRQAADIDRRRPGRAYVRLGAGEVVAVQTALVSAAGSRETAERIAVSPFRLVADADAGAPPASAGGVPTDLEELLAAVTAAAADGGYDAPRVPWPPPLPQEVDAWDLPADPDVSAWADGTPPVPLGIADLPDEQRTDAWWWQPEAGGTLVLGADPSATGDVLAAACLGLARCRHPDRQKIFILDGLGCGLGPLAGLPQVGAVVGVDDGERLSRVLDQLDAEVARRRAGGPGGPDILLVLAGWGALVEGAERAGIGDAGPRLERLLRDGASVRTRLLISAAHERGVPGRVLAQLPTKLCLRLADAGSYTGLGLRARDVPDLRGLRAIEVASRVELHIGRYGRGGPDELASAVVRVASGYPDAVPPPSVGVLPELVPAAEVLGVSALAGATWRLGVGRYYRDLEVASLALAPGVHAVVAGPPGSGRTAALRVLAAAALGSLPETTVCVVAADPSCWDGSAVTEVVGAFDDLSHWPPPGARSELASPAARAGSAPPGRGLLLVDGVESMGPGAAAALDRLVPSVPAGGHVIVAGRADAFRGMQPWQRAVTVSRTGLLLRPASDDGDILRIRLPRDMPPRPVPGRGYLVEAGGLAQIQTAFLSAELLRVDR
jgi:S-DNA-T family DNA segregation ATPase FtsK/SpoIIIE